MLTIQFNRCLLSASDLEFFQLAASEWQPVARRLADWLFDALDSETAGEVPIDLAKWTSLDLAAGLQATNCMLLALARSLPELQGAFDVAAELSHLLVAAAVRRLTCWQYN